ALTLEPARIRLRSMSILDRSMSVNGLTLHYVEHGLPGGRPLVLLHGLTGHARTWDHLSSALCPPFRRLALDQRGHGHSDAPPAQRRPVQAGLAHRVTHRLGRAPDGAFTWKYDRALREMMRGGARRDPIDLWEPLGRIASPTLLVRGSESDILSPEIATKMLE